MTLSRVTLSILLNIMDHDSEQPQTAKLGRVKIQKLQAVMQIRIMKLIFKINENYTIYFYMLIQYNLHVCFVLFRNSLITNVIIVDFQMVKYYQHIISTAFFQREKLFCPRCH